MRPAGGFSGSFGCVISTWVSLRRGLRRLDKCLRFRVYIGFYSLATQGDLLVILARPASAKWKRADQHSLLQDAKTRKLPSNSAAIFCLLRCELFAPKVLEAFWREFCVAHCVLDVAVTEVSLQRSRVVASVR